MIKSDNLSGQTPLLRQRMNGYLLPVPAGDSAVTSLTIGPRGCVFGATTGVKNSHLFVFDNVLNRRIAVLAKLGQPAGIYHSLVSDERENLFWGTMPPVDFLEKVLLPEGYEGGHIYRASVATQVGKNEEGADNTHFSLSEIVDCGIPVKGEGIHNLFYCSQTNRIYGFTYPGVNFFFYDVSTGSFHNQGSVFPSVVPLFFRKQFTARALVSDAAKGVIYGTGENGYFFQFDAATEEFSYLPLQIPGMKSRREWTAAESFCRTPDGVIIGGTTDGYLFKFFPEEAKVVNLGKPSMESRIRGLVTGRNDMIYGVAGDYRGAAHLFSYDLKEGNYDDLGMITYIPVEDSSPWTAYNVEAIVKDSSGIIYLGERDITSHLFTYFP